MKRVVKQFLIASGTSLVLALWYAPPALAQCAMCKVSAAAAGSSAADALNLAILVLLIPPVTIFCAIFIVAYRHRAPQGETSGQTPKDDRASRAWMDEPSAAAKGEGRREGDDGRDVAEAT